MMSSFDWTLQAADVHEFCTDVLLVAPLFGLSYLIQNRDDVGLGEPKPVVVGAETIETTEGSGLPDLRDVSVAARGIYFYFVFSVTMGIAAYAVLSAPKPVLLGVVVFLFAATGIGLFSRFGSDISRRLLEQYQLHRPPGNSPLAPIYEAHPVGSLFSIAREMWSDRRTSADPRTAIATVELVTADIRAGGGADRSGEIAKANLMARHKIVRLLAALTSLWVVFVLLVVVLEIRIFWFTTIA